MTIKETLTHLTETTAKIEQDADELEEALDNLRYQRDMAAEMADTEPDEIRQHMLDSIPQRERDIAALAPAQAEIEKRKRSACYHAIFDWNKGCTEYNAMIKPKLAAIDRTLKELADELLEVVALEDDMLRDRAKIDGLIEKNGCGNLKQHMNDCDLVPDIMSDPFAGVSDEDRAKLVVHFVRRKI